MVVAYIICEVANLGKLWCYIAKSVRRVFHAPGSCSQRQVSLHNEIILRLYTWIDDLKNSLELIDQYGLFGCQMTERNKLRGQSQPIVHRDGVHNSLTEQLNDHLQGWDFTSIVQKVLSSNRVLASKVEELLVEPDAQILVDHLLQCFIP